MSRKTEQAIVEAAMCEYYTMLDVRHNGDFRDMLRSYSWLAKQRLRACHAHAKSKKGKR